MRLELHTVSREGLYEAIAIYEEGTVILKKGSRINTRLSEKYVPAMDLKLKLEDSTIVNQDGEVLRDILFNSLSKAACFVTGRSANGMITWKTEDGKYVRYSLK